MTAASEDPAVEVRGATFSYAGEPALSDVDFALPRGGMLALVGPNGGGKSTLLRGLLHLVDVSGEVRVLGTAPKQARRRCGYVPQVEAVDREFPISTLGVVLMGVGRRTGPPLWPRGRGKAAAREALGRVGLGGHERRPFRVLSGGQRQRVAVARALASRPEVDAKRLGCCGLADGSPADRAGPDANVRIVARRRRERQFGDDQADPLADVVELDRHG